MNNARAIFGVILAATALACVAILHNGLWSRPPFPPQQVEPPQKAASLAQQEFVAEEFADLPRSIHTVPIFRPPAPPRRPAENRNNKCRHRPRALRLSRIFPQLCQHMPNPSMCARGMAAIASTSCAAIMRCGVAPIRGIGKRKGSRPRGRRSFGAAMSPAQSSNTVLGRSR